MIPNAVIIDSVETNLTLKTVSGYHSYNRQISEAAYVELLKTAKQKHGDNIDVVNITWVERDNTFTWSDIIGSRYTYSARGNVITINQTVGMENALERAAKNAIKNVPVNSTIAIAYISAQDQATVNYMIGELEFIWLAEGYKICDRNELDLLRREHNFQMSGEADDSTIVGIGKFLGADFIVTGRVDGYNNLRRLRIRVLNTQTAQLIGAASEQW
jgi:hypothetical protein